VRNAGGSRNVVGGDLVVVVVAEDRDGDVE
jgi:hypothetical protein